MRTASRDRPLIVRPNVAAAGVTASGATPLTGHWNRIDSLASGSAVKMPPAVVGAECVVILDDPLTNTDLIIFPVDGDSFGGGSESAILDGTKRSMAQCYCLKDTVWDAVLSNGVFRLVSSARLVGAGGKSASAVLWMFARSGPAGAGALTGVAVQKYTTNPSALSGGGAVASQAAQKSTNNPVALAGHGVLFCENNYVTPLH